MHLKKLTMHREHPFAALLGMELGEDDDGVVWLTCALEQRHHNPHGVAHGAVAYALLDTAMGAAMVQALGGMGVWATIELKVNYVRSAAEGTLRARARPVHVGKTVVLLEGEVLRDDGELVAKGLGTFLIRARPGE